MFRLEKDPSRLGVRLVPLGHLEDYIDLGSETDRTGTDFSHHGVAIPRVGVVAPIVGVAPRGSFQIYLGKGPCFVQPRDSHGHDTSRFYRENVTPVTDDYAMRIFIPGGGYGAFAPAMLV